MPEALPGLLVNVGSAPMLLCWGTQQRRGLATWSCFKVTGLPLEAKKLSFLIDSILATLRKVAGS